MKRLLPVIIFAFSFLYTSAQIVNIPDPTFKNFLLNYMPRIDVNFDNEIQVSEAAAVTSTLSIIAVNASDLTGIKSFTNIPGIFMSGVPALSLDLSGMANLRSIFIPEGGQFTSLDLSGVTGLTDVQVTHMPQLTSLNVNGLQNLKSLTCHNNGITALNLGNVPNLEILDCRSNKIGSLALNGLLHINTVNCEENDLSILTISNCPSLSTLICGNSSMISAVNHFTSLDLNGLTSLVKLNCSQVGLNSLNLSGCLNLREIGCAQNHLTTLDVSGFSHLIHLGCGNNELTSINITGCDSLQSFDFHSNQMTSFSFGNHPILWQVSCFDNILSSIDLTALTGLQEFNGSYNHLVNIDVSHSPDLTTFVVGNNQLVTVNLKNGTPTPVINLLDNPGLQYLCVDEAEIPGMQDYLLQHSIHGVSINSYCSFVPGGPHNTIRGKITFDADNNGCSVSDPIANGMLVQINDGTQNDYTITDNTTAEYNFYTNAGNFTITPLPQNSYFTISPASATVNFASPGSVVQTTDFCILPNGTHNDLNVTIIPVDRAKPGFACSYRIQYSNTGTTTLSGNVTLQFDAARLNFLNSLPVITNQSPGVLNWAYANLQPFESRNIDLKFIVLAPPVNNINDTLRFIVDIDPVTTDETPLDNNFMQEQIVTGSFDPNDKNCLEGAKFDVARVGDYAHYLVRFQNTGTDVAENVVITDMLEGNFDWNSVVVNSTSHPCIFRQSKGNKLEFIFKGINLPASSVDEPGSHGYVAFKIKTRGNLVLGDSLKNNAAIYFDYNLPVITNTAASVISEDVYTPPMAEYFKGTIQTGQSLLNWKVNCSSQLAEFDIERSGDGRNFTSIYTITATKARCRQPFNYTDINPLVGINYYRIKKMTDVNGRITYTNTIVLLNKETGYEIVNVSPNPVNSKTAVLNITSADKQTLHIVITDVQGKIVSQSTQSIVAGYTSIKLNTENLASGVFNVSVYADKGEKKSTRFVKR